MPNHETFIGAAAAFCTTVSYIPQLRKCWTTGETGDLSLKMLLLLATGLALWLLYGFMRSDSVIMLANGVSLLLLGGLLYFKIRGPKRMTKKRPGRAGCTHALLEASFFDRPADDVARDLLGKALVRHRGGKQQALIISETEAYLGPHDLACHAARGHTPRTEVMFGPPGTLYIYLVYGLHWMLNVVTGPPGYPAAVLLRSAGPLTGPGRLARALAIGRDLNGKAAHPRTGVWFEDRARATAPIIATPRIGVGYAGPFWSLRKLRFILRPENAGAGEPLTGP